jgi:hypothetical protein
MIGDHLLRERLGVCIRLLCESDLTCLHFEQVSKTLIPTERPACESWPPSFFLLSARRALGFVSTDKPMYRSPFATTTSRSTR